MSVIPSLVKEPRATVAISIPQKFQFTRDNEEATVSAPTIGAKTVSGLARWPESAGSRQSFPINDRASRRIAYVALLCPAVVPDDRHRSISKRLSGDNPKVYGRIGPIGYWRT